MSCEQTVIVDVPPHESQLVVKGLFTPDSLWSVHVSASAGFQERVRQAVPNATVEIWQHGQLLEALQPTENGFYRGQHTQPSSNGTYELRVDAPSYDPVRAEASLMDPISAPTFVTETSTDEFGTRSIDITIQDPGSIQNFYALDVVEKVTFPNEQQSGPLTAFFRSGFETKEVILRGVDAFDEAEYFTAAYFSDELFDGNRETITIRVFASFFTIDESDISSPELIVRLRATDEDYYRYHRTVQLQDELGDNPFAEPVRIHSNISNGFGIFAGYHSYEYRPKL